MSFFVRDHILYNRETNIPVTQVKSPNMGGVMRPWLLVYHYTATMHARSALNMLTRTVSPRVSAHILIDRDGEVYQMVPFNRVAWHAGRSQWEGHVGCNNFSIGIEQVNAGVVLKHGDKEFRSQIEHERLDPKDVVHAAHRVTHGMAYWEAYPEVQVDAAIAVGKALTSAYPIKEIVGHEDVAPHRKVDPGPAFPLEHVRDMVLKHGDNEEPILSHTEISHAPETLAPTTDKKVVTVGASPHVVNKGMTPAAYFANATQIYNFFEKAFGHNFACAMVANAQAESSLNPAAVGDHGVAKGLWQLHTDRIDLICDGGDHYPGCNIRITPETSVADQCTAVLHELMHSEHRAMSEIKQSALESASAAAEACCQYYERAGAADAKAKRRMYGAQWDIYFQEKIHG